MPRLNHHITWTPQVRFWEEEAAHLDATEQVFFWSANPHFLSPPTQSTVNSVNSVQGKI